MPYMLLLLHSTTCALFPHCWLGTMERRDHELQINSTCSPPLRNKNINEMKWSRDTFMLLLRLCYLSWSFPIVRRHILRPGRVTTYGYIPDQTTFGNAKPRLLTVELNHFKHERSPRTEYYVCIYVVTFLVAIRTGNVVLKIVRPCKIHLYHVVRRTICNNATRLSRVHPTLDVEPRKHVPFPGWRRLLVANHKLWIPVVRVDRLFYFLFRFSLFRFSLFRFS